MIEITIDEEELRALYLEELNKRLDKLEEESYLMNTKQLCNMLSLSFPTIQNVFLSDPDFPYMRIGAKWVFHRKKVEEYIDKWAEFNNGKYLKS